MATTSDECGNGFLRDRGTMQIDVRVTLVESEGSDGTSAT